MSDANRFLTATDPANVPAEWSTWLDQLAERIASVPLPRATYRVQLNRDCPFRVVLEHVAYLQELGISDVYLSPFLQARPGSLHGYDIVDHSRINAEIGTLDELRTLGQSLRERDMGLIADVVPNHMAASPTHNAWWQDVLENGPSSAYAKYFDIDWMPLKPDLAHKVLLPVLGEQFGDVLEQGLLQVVYQEGAFWLIYFDQRFPIAPGTYSHILTPGLDELTQQLGEEHPDLLELLSVLTAIRNLPKRNEVEVERLVERRREKEIIKRRLQDLTQRSAPMAAFIEQNLRVLNGVPGSTRSFDALDRLLQDQAYRLAYWRVAADEINYRRFFDVNDLVAVATEHPLVFEETHRLIFQLLDEGVITGLRIDHPDGLFDPNGYFHSLQEAQLLRMGRAEWNENPAHAGSPPEADPGAWDAWLRLQRSAAVLQNDSRLSTPLFVVVEKILAPEEPLPESWPVHGTVGYEFLNVVNGVLVDSTAERRMTQLFNRFTETDWDFPELAYYCKRLIVRMSMASELHVLGDRLDRISERNRKTRDFTLNSLTRALQEVVASFSVYRAYVRPGVRLDRDVKYVERAVARAKRRNPAMSSVIFDFVRDVLLLRERVLIDDQEQESLGEFTGKFQQVTGPIMAKAIEDTAFYRFNRLVSLNEVGGEPATFGVSLADFHRYHCSRLPRFANSLNASSTHDTKRSEDVRARIHVLSEIPQLWRERVTAWSRTLRRSKREVDGVEAPSSSAEYLFYQTLVGIWPEVAPDENGLRSLEQRLQGYMLKVEREAKVHTSWISPDEAYEAALQAFVAELFAPKRRALVADLQSFVSRLTDHGRWNSLSQLLIKLTAPGVPDFFQGMENWCHTLVDPDNRHPVDFAAAAHRLQELQTDFAASCHEEGAPSIAKWWLNQPEQTSNFAAHLLETRHDGRIKLFVTWLGLQFRRQSAELFRQGDYVPLEVDGEFADSVIAYARVHRDGVVVVVAPRWTVRVTGFGGAVPVGEHWQGTAVRLPEELTARRPLRNLFTGESSAVSSTSPEGDAVLPVATALSSFPVGLLYGAAGDSAGQTA